MSGKVLFSLYLLILQNFTFGVEVGPWDAGAIHQIAGTITFPNPNTLAIENFRYDGGGVTVFLYYYAPGQEVNDVSGTILPLPANEGGPRGQFNRAYTTGETLVVPLPAGLTACDIGALTIWCEPFTFTFSEVTIPRSIFENDGAGECMLEGGDTDLGNLTPTSFDNCESFADDTIQVSWNVDTANQEVDFQLCGCRPLDLNLNQYMAFGLSGRTDRTFMVGADATVAWVDNRVGMPNAVDYYLTERVQCRAGEGACPDTMVTRNGRQCTNDVRNGSVVGGIRNSNQQCVTFSRPLTSGDSDCDRDIDPTNTDQYIVWANGGLGETAFIHFERSGGNTPPIHLGRSPSDQCSSRPIMCGSCPAFSGQTMFLPEDTTLRVHIGPAAGERGYAGITGQSGWGIAYYINGSLIPELVVERNRTYTFIVEGGTDTTTLGRYHPFYITDSINGGRLQNTVQQREMETVYAGFDEEDNPTGVGRYCEFEETIAARTTRETCGSLENYLRDLTAVAPVCDPGDSGILTWTPDEDTPDIVYYQCATHLNLGWRIRVQDIVEMDNMMPGDGGEDSMMPGGGDEDSMMPGDGGEDSGNRGSNTPGGPIFTDLVGSRTSSAATILPFSLLTIMAAVFGLLLRSY